MKSSCAQVGTLAVVAAAAVSGICQGAIIAEYNFEQTFTSSNVNAGVVASAITPTGLGTLGGTTNAGHGYTAANAGTPTVDAPLDGSTFWTYWTYGATGGTNTTNTLAQAITNGAYYEFTITPNANYKYTLESITFNVDAMVASTSAALYLVIDANNNGYTTADQVGTTATITSTTAGNRTINFSAAYVDLTTATTARIYVSDNQSNSTNTRRWFVWDNLDVNGTVTPVPEPTVLSLAGLAGLCLARRRRA